jgi:prepilin-type N-terminal cleavage/methylation domain-containing protein
MKHLRMKENLNQQSGFSLVEILVSISIFSFLILVSIGSFSQANQALKRQEQGMTRSRLFQSLIYVMGMPAALRAAGENAGEGSRLWACIQGGACHVGNYTDVVLYLPPLVADTSQVVTSGAITGTTADPLLYNLDGIPCKPGETCSPEDYPVSVSTQFDGICPPQYDQTHALYWPEDKPINPDGLEIKTSCHHTHYIKIKYTFKPTAGAPASMYFEPVTGTLWVSAVALRLGF